jgi:hypothetical protein
MEEDRGKIEERMVNGARGVYIVVQAARGRPCPSWHTKPFGVVHRQFTLEKGSTIILSWQCLMSQPLLKPSLASPDALLETCSLSSNSISSASAQWPASGPVLQSSFAVFILCSRTIALFCEFSHHRRATACRPEVSDDERQAVACCIQRNG